VPSIEETHKPVLPVPITRPASQELRKATPPTPSTSTKAKHNKKPVRLPSAEKTGHKPLPEETARDKASTPKGSRGPSISKHVEESDEEDEGWFSDDAVGGKHSVKSH